MRKPFHIHAKTLFCIASAAIGAALPLQAMSAPITYDLTAAYFHSANSITLGEGDAAMQVTPGTPGSIPFGSSLSLSRWGLGVNGPAGISFIEDGEALSFSWNQHVSAISFVGLERTNTLATAALEMTNGTGQVLPIGFGDNTCPAGTEGTPDCNVTVFLPGFAAPSTTLTLAGLSNWGAFKLQALTVEFVPAPVAPLEPGEPEPAAANALSVQTATPTLASASAPAAVPAPPVSALLGLALLALARRR